MSQLRSWTQLSHVQRTSRVNQLDRLVVGTSFGLVYTGVTVILVLYQYCVYDAIASQGLVLDGSQVKFGILAVSH